MSWIWVLAGLGLILILGLAGSTLWLRSQVLLSLRQLRVRLYEIDGEVRQFNRILKLDFAEQTPAAVHDHLLEIKAYLEEITSDLRKIYRRYGILRQSILRIFPTNRLRVIQSPVDWYQCYLNTLDLAQALEQLERKCRLTYQRIQDVREIGWILGQRFREVYVLHRDSAQMIEDLVEKGVHGSALEDAAEQLEIIGRLMGEIPLYFLSEEKTELLQLCVREDIEKVFSFLEENEERIRRIYKRISQWSELLEKSYQQMVEIQKITDILTNLFPKIPDDLDIDQWMGKFRFIQDEFQAIDKHLACPSVYSLSELAKKSYRMLRMLIDIEKSVQEANNQLKLVHTLNNKLRPQFVMLEEEIAKIDRNPVYRVLLEESRVEYLRIQEGVKHYCDSDAKKKPEELAAMIREMVALNENAARLIEYLQNLRKQHTDLLMLLRLIDLPQAIRWCSEVEGLVPQIQQYDPENFAHKEDLRITPDLETLRDILANQLPQDSSFAIPEKELPQLYKQAFTASELYQVLQDQVNRVKNELEQLIKAQRQQGEKIEGAVYVLKQLRVLAENNPALEKILAGEVVTLLNQVEKQQSILGQTQKGTLEKKIKKSEHILETVFQKCDTWLIRLVEDVDRYKKDIEKTLREVERIAHLDDPIIHEYDGLFAREEESPARNIQASMSSEEIVECYQGWHLQWQKITAAYPKLMQILKPVLTTHSEMMDKRQKAEQAINEIGTNIETRRTTLFQQIEREYLDLEHEIDRIKTSRYRALFLSSRLKEFSNQYQDITIRITKLGERVENYRERVKAVNEEIEASLAAWQTRLSEYQDNSLAKREINQLIVDTQKNIEQIKTDYSQMGELSQQQVSLLTSISRRLKDRIVPIGNQQWINIEGKIRGYS